MAEPRRFVILGAGGHARCLQGILPYPTVLITNDDDVQPDDCVVIGVGDLHVRRRLFGRFREQVLSVDAGRRFVDLSPGLQMMPGSIVMPNCTIGENVLINTGAQVDHDCNIGNHCHIAPGAILCGEVTVGEGCFIGAGAIVPEGETIPPGTFMKAGSVYPWGTYRIG